MRKQQKHLKDQYFTDPKIAKKLVELFDKKVGFDKFKIIVEPSAGNGSFLKNIYGIRKKRTQTPHNPRNSRNTQKIIGLDIKPLSKNIKKQNFLKWNFPHKNIPRDKVLCIGNPPFGRQSSLAKHFIKKCAEFSDNVAFILPISFNTQAFKKSLPLGFHKQWSKKLSTNIFIDPQGNPFSQPLKTMFVYYKKDGKQSRCQSSPIPNDLWKFMKKTDASERSQSDFRIIRASGTPGRAISIKSPNFVIKGKTFNDYYIKILTPIKRYRRLIISDVNDHQQYNKWKFNNTTTFKSIDKNQITKVLNAITQQYYIST